MSDDHPYEPPADPDTTSDASNAERPPRKAAIAFILLTVFIDILGIGIVIPVLPELVTELVPAESVTVAEEDTSAAVQGIANQPNAIAEIDEGQFDSQTDSQTDLEAAFSPTVVGSPGAAEGPASNDGVASVQSGVASVQSGVALGQNDGPPKNKVAKRRVSIASWYYGIIATVYALMQFVFAPVVGALSDRFGRRPIILGSLFGLGIDFLIQGFANSLIWLFVGRMLAGIMGASFSTANAYIADVSDDDTRARNFGFVGVMFGLGFTIGPALGGFLGAVDLRIPFFVAAGLALVNWLYGFFVLPESLPPEKRTPFTLANANPIGAIKQIRAYPFVAGLAGVFVLKSFAQRGLENVWVLSTKYRFGWDQMTNGWALCLVGVMAIIVQGGMVRPVIKRLGERKTIVVATLLTAITFACYGLANQGWMMYCIIVFGSLGGLAGPAIQSLVTSTVDDTDQGKIQGAMTSMISITNVIAPIFFTTGLFTFFTADSAPVKVPGAPFLVGSVILFIALFIAKRVFGRFPVSGEPAATESDSQTG